MNTNETPQAVMPSNKSEGDRSHLFQGNISLPYGCYWYGEGVFTVGSGIANGKRTVASIRPAPGQLALLTFLMKSLGYSLKHITLMPLQNLGFNIIEDNLFMVVFEKD